LKRFFSNRRQSIDQLTEEAEADLANNNDPNNNSSNADEEDQQQDQHLLQQQQQAADAAVVAPLTRHSSNDDDVEDPKQVELEKDIVLILKLMPDKTYDEVRFLLESHSNNPSRVQVL
jgi:hypothetical protein